jgi:ABC-type glutathione transport system ATPase component
MQPLLEVRGLSKSFATGSGRSRRSAGGSAYQPSPTETAAVRCVSLEVREGGSLGIVGESGAGKTTLAALMTGMLEPDSGEILFDGEVISPKTDRALLALQLQMVWQDANGSLDPRYRVRKCIAEPLEIHGRTENIAAKVTALMDEVGLKSELAVRYPHELSGGEVQRVVIARALSLDPRLLICDEPASALDTLNKKRIIRRLAQLRRDRGLTYVVISHDLPAISELVDHLIIMREGEVVESGEASKVLNGPRNPYTRKLISAVPMMPGSVTVNSKKQSSKGLTWG